MGTTSEESDEPKRLRRDVAELLRAHEIVKAAWACAEPAVCGVGPRWVNVVAGRRGEQVRNNRRRCYQNPVGPTAVDACVTTRLGGR